MLATKIHSETAPRRVSPSALTVANAFASATCSQSPAAPDLEFLKELGDSKVMDHLKHIFQLARADDRAIRLPEVLKILSTGKSSWYQRLNARSPSYDPLAPKPFKLGNSERSPSLWWYSEIIAYLEVRATVSRKR